jgi:nucleoside-diphosphate-sugar epimerase
VDVPANVLDISRARRALGWGPTVAFEDGIERSIRAMKRLLG